MRKTVQMAFQTKSFFKFIRRKIKETSIERLNKQDTIMKKVNNETEFSTERKPHY